MDTIRAFIGIPLPKAVGDELADVSRRLQMQLPSGGVRWVQPDRLHLTLRFLGQTAVSDISRIAERVDDACAKLPTISLHLSRLGCFPNQRRPRVIWAGLSGDTASLQQLKQSIDQMLLELGWEMEQRPFHPHLTLGRVKDAKKIEGLDLGLVMKGVAVEITAVHLIESRLKPTGPDYIVRHSSQLKM